MPINKEKYQEVILYLCQKLAERLKEEKLAKLLYFADFDFYEINQKSITGDVYRAFPKDRSHLHSTKSFAGSLKKKLWQ